MAGEESRSSGGMRPDELAAEITERLRALPTPTAESARRVRREYSRELRGKPGRLVIELAERLVDDLPWVAYELINQHPEALSELSMRDVRRLGAPISSWGTVDAFGVDVTGPAWRLGVISDSDVLAWTASPDRWWRRTALVSTVALNTRSRGGTGDVERTLAVCTRLIRDRDDMVVKAMSWSLRSLIHWAPEAVRRFLSQHEDEIAARIKREVTNKLETGLKDPKRR